MIIRKICDGFMSKAFFQRLSFFHRPIKNEVLFSVINSSKFDKNFAIEMRWKSTNSSIDDEALDKPVKFSTSKAARFKSEELFYTIGPGQEKPLWYQQYVVLASLFAFMIYFMLLREENDVDQKLSRSFFDHFDELELQKLQNSLQYKKELNLDTEDVENQIKKIEKRK